MIPGFSAGGVLPPFAGDPAASSQRSPYATSMLEVVERFASSTRRCNILRGWLRHRAALHALGFVVGFQWVNGSFCEQLVAREPNDVDLVTFLIPPAAVDLKSLMASHPTIFVPRQARAQYLCDVYFLRLSPDGYADPRRVSYFYSLFSHRRDLTWKGILEVPLDPADDASADAALMQAASARLLPIVP